MQFTSITACIATLLIGCGQSQLGGGPCDGVNPADECGLECSDDDPCNQGFYCAADGACTADCIEGSDDCGDGMRCDANGRCVDAPTDDPMDCPSVAVDLAPQTPTVVLLVDQSGSMTADIGGVRRWEAVESALIDPVNGVVTQLQDRVIFGASLYTSDGGNAGGTCPMLAETNAIAMSNRDPIALLFDTNEPQGDTPTAEAITAVAASFPPVDPVNPGPRVIVLATDGDPDNCVDPDAHDDGSKAGSEAAVAAAFAAGIETYVLSVGDDVTETHLDRLADIGIGAAPGSGLGTAYVGTSPAALVDAFDAIIRGTRTCTFTLDGTVDPGAASSGTVRLNGAALTHGVDWSLTDGTTLELMGDACTQFLEDDTVVLSAEFPCGTVVL